MWPSQGAGLNATGARSGGLAGARGGRL